MAKTDKPRDEKKAAAAYYRINTRAVDDLVNANPENSPEVSPRELRKYQRRGAVHIGRGVQFFLVKWWFAGVACWFFMMGLAGYGIANLDMILILGAVVGLLWDLPVNMFIRMKADKPGENDRFMMFPKTGVAAGLLNALYGLALIFLVAQTYGVLNALLAGEDGAVLNVGPILFGVFTAGWDWLCLRVRGLAGRILADAKKSAAEAARRG